MYILILQKGKMGKAWNPYKNNDSFRK